MRRAPAGFWLALEFLTIVRLRRDATYEGKTLGASLAWFPAVGLLIGALLVGIDWSASRALPAPAAAAVLTAALVLVSGALHLDGLADTADGIFGGHTPEQRLAIMRDSRTGSFGAVAVALALLLTYSALLSISGSPRHAVLLVVPALARLAMVLAVAAFPYARPSGLGRLYQENAGGWPVATAALSATAAAIILLGAGGIALAGSAVVVALAAGRFCLARLGGMTGDTYGAVGVLTEVSLLLVAAGGSKHGWLAPWLAP